MSASWPVTVIRDVCEMMVDCVNRTAPLSEVPTPFKMIRTTNVRGGWIDTESVQYVDEPTFVRWTRRGAPRRGDVILTREAPLGEVGMIRTDEPVFLGQRLYMYRADETKLDSHFLLYSMLDEYVQGQVRSYGSGSTVEHMRLPDCERLRLRLPPLNIQRKIAGILSAYDDLIENNTRRIKILEEMAQRIYREWFVDFRYPGHEDVPLVASELGPIPDGWSWRPMAEIADVVDCLHSKKPSHDPTGAGLLLQLFNVGDNGVLNLTERYLISPHDYAVWTSRIEVTSGDCVVTNVGRVGAVAQIPSGVVAALGRNMTAIRPHTAVVGPTYLIEYLLSPLMEREIQVKKDAGSIMDSLNVKGIVRLSVPVPTKALMSRFEEIARPMRRDVEVTTVVVRNLRATRDLLLPRLISGEIDVDNMAITVEEAAA